MIKILQAETPEQIEAAQTLFREYERWLNLDICFQNFEQELLNLPGKYAKPDGRLLLALANEKTAGCVALRKIEENVCEMKRLFVREEFRGFGLGEKLIEKLIAEAREIGYGRIRLDTLPGKMRKAVKLYESFGFRQIASYCESPYKETLFWKKL